MCLSSSENLKARPNIITISPNNQPEQSESERKSQIPRQLFWTDIDEACDKTQKWRSVNLQASKPENPVDRGNIGNCCWHAASRHAVSHNTLENQTESNRQRNIRGFQTET